MSFVTPREYRFLHGTPTYGRRITWLLNKQIYAEPLVTWPAASEWFKRERSIDYTAYMLATDEELEASLKK